MPPKRSVAPAFSTGALAMIRGLRERIEATKIDLHAKRAAAVATISEIDEALAELGETASPPPVATTTKREPTVTRAPREPGVPEAPTPGSDKILDELRSLAPWIHGLRDNQKKIISLRLTGKSSTEIAAKLGSTVKDVANAIYAGRARLRELLTRGAPAPAPATDSEEDPEPAQGDRIAAEFDLLRPHFGELSDEDRKIAELRADGKLPAEIRDLVGHAVADRLYQLKTELQRRRGATRSRESTPSVNQPGVCQPDAGLSTEPAPALDWSLIGADTQGWVGRERTPMSEGDEPVAEEPPQGVAVSLADLPALIAGPIRTAPGVPTWILDRLLPAWWTAYQGVVVEGVHPDVVAYLNDTTAQEVSRKAKAAETQIDRLKIWERDRKADGVPLTDEDKLGTAPAAPDPLLAALGIKQEPKTQGDAKRAAMAAMSEHFHRLAPRQLQLAELYVSGKTNAEIAAEMGIRLATVDNNLNATRARLEGCARYTAPVEILPVMPMLRPEIARLPVINPPPDVADAMIDSFKGTGIERARAKLHVINGRTRAKTIAPRGLSRDERRLSEMLGSPTHVERPITRGDCEADPGRPCPWVSCPHHLYLDVNEKTGAIKLNFPHLEVWEMKESCSLDVADRGGVTLEEVGDIVNLTRERIRQIEVRGLERIRRHGGEMEDARVRDYSPLGDVMG